MVFRPVTTKLNPSVHTMDPNPTPKQGTVEREIQAARSGGASTSEMRLDTDLGGGFMDDAAVFYKSVACSRGREELFAEVGAH